MSHRRVDIEPYHRSNRTKARLWLGISILLLVCVLAPAAWLITRTLLREAAVRELPGAIEHGVIADVRRCVSLGAPVETTDPMYRATALHVAADHGDLRLATLLLGRGAEPNLADVTGETPLDYAAGGHFSSRHNGIGDPIKGPGCLEVTRLLLEHGADPGKGYALWRAARTGNSQLVEALLRAGAPPNKVFPENSTPLIIAIYFADVDRPPTGDRTRTVRLLLNHGADPNVAWDGCTALMSAAAHGGDKEVVRLLLAAGANPHLRDPKGKSAVDYALGSHQLEAVQLLRQALRRRGSAKLHRGSALSSRKRGKPQPNNLNRRYTRMDADEHSPSRCRIPNGGTHAKPLLPNR